MGRRDELDEMLGRLRSTRHISHREQLGELITLVSCHDMPATAPPMIVRQYGPANGFGWKLHETVDAQIVSVPLDTALARVDRTVGIVAGTLVTLFLLLFAVVNVVLRRIVLKPIALLATAAESISTGQKVDVI